MVKTAYVVCQGCYSDRSIRRVYLDRAEAEAYVAEKNSNLKSTWYSEYDIEEYPIGSDGYYSGPVWCAHYQAHDDPRPGLTGSGEKVWSHDYDGPVVGKAKVEIETYANGWLTVSVIGISRDHVVKAFHDAGTRLKAHRAGIA